MVRPNQIIERDDTEFTFIMFAQSKGQVKRRVVALNFPSIYLRNIKLGQLDMDDFVTGVEVLMESVITRYAVTVDMTVLDS